jgi:hypothetical protein
VTTFTFTTGQEAIAAGVAAFALSAFGLLIGLGWVRFSFSVSAVPPWNRKPAAKKQPDSAPAVAASSGEGTTATAAGAVPKTMRKVS